VRLRTRTSPGVSLLRLDAVDEAINPSPVELESEEDERAYLEWAFRYALSSARVLAKAVRGEKLEAVQAVALEAQLARFRLDVGRVAEELIRRVGTTRSRLALIQRFKLRADWHDRDRLIEVAESSKGKPEDRLTAELARFLFDQGLSPVTKPLVGQLEPDLLDPSVRPSFYVEAKQYASSGNARRNLTRAVAQVHDTVGGMMGSPFECNEAFIVVFRRGGPRYILPAELTGEGWTTHLILIDLAPSDERGSRSRQRPVVLGVDDFFA
jgi:hypothetical protein